MRAPGFLARLPRLRWRPPPAETFVAVGDPTRSDELARDVDLLDRELMPAFRRLDASAGRAQNAFRLERLTLIMGGALATSLGAAQAAAGGGLALLAITQATVAGALSLVAFRARARTSQQLYLTSRLKAERLRSEYFLFLIRAGSYADESTRAAALRLRVSDIETDEAAA